MPKVSKCLSCQNEFIFKADSKRRRRKFCSLQCKHKGHKGWKRTEEQSLKLLQKRYNQKIIKNYNGCWQWTGTINDHGYGMMYHKNKPIGLHRVSWLIHKGEIPKDKWVLHHCDNRICSNPEHLYLGNAQDNTNDMIKRKRTNYRTGFISKRRQLNDEIVKLIKKDLLDNKMTMREISRKYNCHSGTVSEIYKNNIYKSVTI